MKFEPTLHKLSNGLAVILDPADIATTSMEISVGVGSRNERPDEYGITHFAEHMLCKGTPRFPSPKLLKDNVLDNGGGSNASTNRVRLRLHGRILSENFHILCGNLADRLQNSLFDSDSLENERKVILDEARRYMDDSYRQFTEFMNKNIFPNSGYDHSITGTDENIKSFSREKMIGYLNKFLSAKNTIICICGKIDNQEKLLAQLEKSFAWIPSIDVPAVPKFIVRPSVAHNLKSDKNNVLLSIMFENPCELSFENNFKTKCSECFKEILNLRMRELIRNKHGLVYGIDIGRAGNEYIIVNEISTSCSADNLAQVVTLFAQSAADILQKNPVSKEELARYKIIEKFRDANWLESTLNRRDTLINYYRKFEKIYDLSSDVEMLGRMTLDDVAKNSANLFDAPISILTQGPAFDTDLKQIWEDNFKV